MKEKLRWIIKEEDSLRYYPPLCPVHCESGDSKWATDRKGTALFRGVISLQLLHKIANCGLIIKEVPFLIHASTPRLQARN